jgi:KipI family sensor histidine kinase inhibitor
MTRSVPEGEIRLLGDRALLIGVADPPAGRALADALAVDTPWEPGDAEVVCGFTTVLLHARDPALELDDLRRVAEAARATVLAPTDTGATGDTVTIPCTFDGPDLDEVAARIGCAPGEVAELLSAQPLTVAVMGFSPGFAYLDGLPDALRGVPRRDRPRPVVPAGSVALANGHAAVYPTASPGGWQLVGRTDVELFSPTRAPYARLAPGDRVQFTVAAGRAAPGGTATGDPWTPPDGARAVFEVMDPGLRSVVQDAGRQAAAIGVPTAGPADPVSHTLANRLVGNADGAAALEVTAGGARLRCVGPCHVAVAGADPDLRLDGSEAPAGQVLALRTGQVLLVGRLRRGVRAYLAVAGGLLGPSQLGSQGSDELCGLGPGPLGAGHVLHAGAWGPPLGDHLVPGAATEAGGDEAVELRVVPGPHHEWFAADALARLAQLRFAVSADSNRVGLRLQAPGAELGERKAGELDSQGVVTGAVQIPPGGEPVVLGPDHATLGGYPVLAVVASADHGLLGQCGPGTAVRLVPISHDEASEAWHAARRLLQTAVMGHFPLAAG